MDNQQIIQLLQKRRHNDLNELQLIKAYGEMGKLEQLKVKLAEVSEKIMLEQRLFNLSIPKFTMFIIQFNHKFSHARLTYDIHIDQASLAHVEDKLLLVINIIATFIKSLQSELTLYYIHIKFNEINCQKKAKISFQVKNLTTEKSNELKSLISQKMQEAVIEQNRTDELTIQIIVPKDK